MADNADQIRRQILDLTAQYYSEISRLGDFIPGVSPVPVSGKVIDGADISAVVDSALDGWFTTGRFAETFERNLARFVGVRSASLVNSGSSANLVALSALTSPKLGDRRLKPGDEVITVAAGFPTTVNPIFQNRLVPVFVDVTVPQYEIDVNQLEAARSDRTKAVFIAHTLGNVFDLDAITAFTRQAQSLADRRLLRCAGFDLQGTESRHLWRYRHSEFLSCPSHHDRRRRRGPYRQACSANADRVLSRLGSRLLVRTRQGQHLRQAF